MTEEPIESFIAQSPLPRSSGFFQAKDGTRLFYQTIGQGQPLILAYGLLCTQEHWRHQVAYFAKHYRVVLFDYRGHHRSAIPANDRCLTLDWCAEDLIGLLDHLGIERAVCFGHSLGVPIVARAMLLASERISAAVFVCGSVSNPFERMLFTDRLDRVFEVSSLLYEYAPGLLAQAWKKLTGRNPLSFFLTSQLGFNPSTAQERDIASYLESVSRGSFSVFHALLGDLRRTDLRPRLPELRSPVLVIAGEDDCITPMPLQEEIVRLLPQGELERIEGGSHNAHTDFPVLVNSHIEKFLKRMNY